MSDDRLDSDPAHLRAAAQAEEIGAAAAEDLYAKFLRGQREHGGDLFRKPVLDEAYAEALDLFTYLHVERQHKAQAIRLLEVAVRAGAPPETTDALNLLRAGNVEGA